MWRCADDVRGRYGRLPRTHDRVNNWLWSGVGGCCGKLVAETWRYVRNSGLLRDMRGSNPELGSRLAVAVGFGLSEPAVVSVVPGSCRVALRGFGDVSVSAGCRMAVVPRIPKCRSICGLVRGNPRRDRQMRCHLRVPANRCYRHSQSRRYLPSAVASSSCVTRDPAPRGCILRVPSASCIGSYLKYVLAHRP